MIEDGHDTAEIVRAQRTGRDQDIELGESLPISHCVFVPAAGQSSMTVSRESGGLADQVATDAVLYVPPGEPVSRATDKIRVRGELWNCAGRPAVWTDLEGEVCGYEQRLRKVVG